MVVEALFSSGHVQVLPRLVPLVGASGHRPRACQGPFRWFGIPGKV